MLGICLRLPATSSSLYTDDMPTIATSRQAMLLVKYLGRYLIDLVLWPRKWRIAINVLKGSAMLFAKAGRQIPKPRPVWESIQWVDPWYTAHIDQVRKKAVQREGVLGSFLYRRSRLSIRNGVPLHTQLMRPMVDYACPFWRAATRSHTRKLQMLQSNCLCIATSTPWYIGNGLIHDLGVPFFADHSGSLKVLNQLMWGTP
jgi:hypothetical protein